MGNNVVILTADKILHGNDLRMNTPIEIALKIDADGYTTARTLYEFLDLNLGNYSRWCKSNIVENKFAEENVDYFPFLMNEECGGQATTDYKLTSHFAKKLSMKGNGERAEQAREYFTQLEEKVKEVAINRSLISPQMQMLMSIVEAQADKLKELESRIITHNEDYFTVAGYASLRGFNVDINKANMLGRKASKLSKEYGYDIYKAKDPRFGTVNTYHTDILKQVFDE